jgi:ribosomal protein L37AE/L43A
MVTRKDAKMSVGKGWHGLIDEFYDAFPDANVIQVKEKYGTLCIYHDNCTDESTQKEIEIRDRSATMCEECGKPAVSEEERGWISTLCKSHRNVKKHRIDYVWKKV